MSEMNKLASVILLAIDLLFSSLSIASNEIGIGYSSQRFIKEYAWPRIVDDNNETLGLFGGVSIGYNQDAVLESTMLLITSTGYIAPILNNGGIATVTVTYFQDKGCNGSEFQPASMKTLGFSPYRGMVFRSLSIKDLAYIPKKARRRIINAQSRLILSHSDQIMCKTSTSELEAYKLVPNQYAITRIDPNRKYASATVEVGEISGNTTRQFGRMSETTEKVNSEHANKSSDIIAEQEECSPACISNAVGNGTCDIECYVEACYFDKGDCNSIAPEMLQQMLSKICSPGCDIDDIGDGYCDNPCNTQACQHDGGDCE